MAKLKKSTKRQVKAVAEYIDETGREDIAIVYEAVLELTIVLNQADINHLDIVNGLEFALDTTSRVSKEITDE